MTRPRSPFPHRTLIIAVGTLILAALAATLIGVTGLVETADPWLQPFVPVLDAVYAILNGNDCHAPHTLQAVGTVLSTPTC